MPSDPTVMPDNRWSQVFQINLSLLTWIWTVFLDHCETWESTEWGKNQESCPRLVLSQACNGTIRRWSPLGGQKGLSWAQLCRDTLSSLVGNCQPWAGAEAPHVMLFLSQSWCWTLIVEQTPASVKWAQPRKEAVPTLAEPAGEEKWVITWLF